MLEIGLQAYSVRNEMARDFFGTLSAVADAGYRYLEWANPNARMDFGCGYGVEAMALQEMLDEVGITSLAAHVTPLDADNVASVIAYHKQIGTRYIVSKGVPDSGETLVSMSRAVTRSSDRDSLLILTAEHAHCGLRGWRRRSRFVARFAP